MNKNILLHIVNSLCYFFKTLIAISIVGITVLLIHFQFNRSSYENWNLEFRKDRLKIISNSDENLTYSLGGNKPVLNFHKDRKISIKGFEPEGKSLNNWKNGSLYFNYFKAIAILFLIYSIIRQIGKVVRSVKEFRTFHQVNIIAFKKIGKYCLLIFFLSIFNYWKIGDYSRASVSLYPTPILISLLAFFLSEVFKEGKEVMQENELTI